jgi:hypothetical protein
MTEIILKRIGIALVLLAAIVIFVIAPLVTAWGVVNGKLDVESLEPYVSVQEQKGAQEQE